MVADTDDLGGHLIPAELVPGLWACLQAGVAIVGPPVPIPRAYRTEIVGGDGTVWRWDGADWVRDEDVRPDVTVEG